MNRRSLVGSAVALLPATALSQATPDAMTGHRPGSLLRQYLELVWDQRNPDAIADFFDPDIFDLLDVQREHIIALDGLAEDEPSLRIRALTSDATHAMAYCAANRASGGSWDMFVVIRMTDDGMIGFYRWMGQPELE